MPTIAYSALVLRPPFSGVEKSVAELAREALGKQQDATQARVWRRFTPILNPGGVLYIGHSERVTGPAAAELHPAGLTTYVKGEAA